MLNSRLMLAAAVGLSVGLAGETLLFLERQCRRIESGLREDFRVVLLLPDALDEGQRKLLEEKLLAMPDVAELRFVGKAEALNELRRAEPELVESVTLVSDNPLSSAFEVRLADDRFGRAAQWLDEARALAEWPEVLYKPAQLQAVLQAQFYAHLINLALSALVCLFAGVLVAAAWPGVLPGAKALSWARGWPCAAAGAAGAVAGAGMIAAVALPMRLLTPWWAWPSAAAQLGLVAGGALAAWVLCGRD